MIQFNFIIHKETGTVIKYEDWKNYVDNELTNMFIKYNKGLKPYNTKEMLFSDDFEIIYNSEFTALDLIQLYAEYIDIDIRLKLKKAIDQRQNLKRKYNEIEV